MEDPLVDKVLTYLREHLSEAVTLTEVASAVGMGVTTLAVRFKAETGKSVMATLGDLRLEEGARLLREGRLSVSEVAHRTGFGTPSHFGSMFKRRAQCPLHVDFNGMSHRRLCGHDFDVVILE